MPKFVANTSRWFRFVVNSDECLKSDLQKCGCSYSQWVSIDGVISGYMYFETSRIVPKRKVWIYGASISITDTDSLKELYKGVSYRSWSGYGSKKLFDVPKLVVPSIMYTPPTPPRVDTPPPSPSAPQFAECPDTPPRPYDINNYDEDDEPHYVAPDGTKYPGEFGQYLLKYLSSSPDPVAKLMDANEFAVFLKLYISIKFKQVSS